MSSRADDTTGRTPRDVALGWAHSARRVRHDTRERLGAGELDLAGVLDAARTDELLGELKLLWVLESLPGARKVDTRRRLGELGLEEGARLRALDEPTRRVVLDTFGPQGGSR